jgi:hypothetical protein
MLILQKSNSIWVIFSSTDYPLCKATCSPSYNNAQKSVATFVPFWLWFSFVPPVHLNEMPDMSDLYGAISYWHLPWNKLITSFQIWQHKEIICCSPTCYHSCLTSIKLLSCYKCQMCSHKTYIQTQCPSIKHLKLTHFLKVQGINKEISAYCIYLHNLHFLSQQFMSQSCSELNKWTVLFTIYHW